MHDFEILAITVNQATNFRPRRRLEIENSVEMTVISNWKIWNLPYEISVVLNVYLNDYNNLIAKIPLNQDLNLEINEPRLFQIQADKEPHD